MEYIHIYIKTQNDTTLYASYSQNIINYITNNYPATTDNFNLISIDSSNIDVRHVQYLNNWISGRNKPDVTYSSITNRYNFSNNSSSFFNNQDYHCRVYDKEELPTASWSMPLNTIDIIIGGILDNMNGTISILLGSHGNYKGYGPKNDNFWYQDSYSYIYWRRPDFSNNPVVNFDDFVNVPIIKQLFEIGGNDGKNFNAKPSDFNGRTLTFNNVRSWSQNYTMGYDDGRDGWESHQMNMPIENSQYPPISGSFILYDGYGPQLPYSSNYDTETGGEWPGDNWIFKTYPTWPHGNLNFFLYAPFKATI